MKKEDRQPSEVGGFVAVVVSIGVLLIDIFIPARKGADPADTYYIAAFALMLMGWGISQIRSARKKKNGHAAADEKDDPNDNNVG
jgi:hypothetical protein